ncbi:TPA: hypothetical protein ACH3X3_008234 [Trebouxia sp. C0006]
MMSGEEAKLKLKIEQAEAAVARAQKEYEEAEPGSSKDSCLQLLLAEKASLLADKKALEQVREKDLLQQRAAAGAAPLGKRGGGVTSVDDHYHDQLPHLKKARTDAGVEGLDREEIAALINKKLPTASSYSKATAGGWADNRYKTLQPYVNFHRQHTPARSAYDPSGAA